MSSPSDHGFDDRLPTRADIEAAALRLAGIVVATPLLEAPLVNARLGARLLVKAEALQRTGSYKFRGAYNALSQFDPAARAAGVVAYSSGNHAQGVAAAATLLGIPATIVMPADAPALKRANTKALGAEIVLYDRYREQREAIAAEIAARRGATILPPFDDPRIIAGQASVGVELARQAAAMGVSLDAVLVPCSGGGLLAGCALALSTASPGTAIYAVEPEGLDDMRRSLETGERQKNDPSARSACDALLSPSPGVLPFAVARRHVAGGLTATDREVARGMATAFTEYKLVLEPGGAIALAAVLAGRIDIAGKTIAVIASGGNVDPAMFMTMLSQGLESAGQLSSART
jgi:threonine dehydratase